MQPEPIFQEEQQFQPARTRFLLAAMPLFLTLVCIWQIVLKHPFGKHPMSNGGLIFWTIFLWVIYLRLLTVRLVTQVMPGELSIGLRGLWRPRHVPLKEIRTAKVVKFDPMREFGGYGIRSTRAGKAYVSGTRSGVRVELRNDDVLIIGSTRADILAAALGRGAR